MQALALLLFIVPFTLSFFLNGCFEADMDSRSPSHTYHITDNTTLHVYTQQLQATAPSEPCFGILF